MEYANVFNGMKPEGPENNLYSYGNYEWKSGEEWAIDVIKLREERFINTYQIDPNAIGTEAYQKALELFMKEEERVVELLYTKGISPIESQYGGSLSEFLKANVVEKGLSKREWLDLAENNYNVLSEHVNRDDFASRPPLAKKLLTRQLELAQNILEDMKATWKYGEVDIRS